MNAFEISLPYGHRELTVRLEADRFLGYLDPSPAPSLEDPAAAIKHAVRHPFGPSLRDVVGRGDRVLLMTVDITRPSPSLLVNALREELDALGAEVDVIIGLGTHRPMTAPEIGEHTGVEEAFQSQPDGESVNLGTTSRGTPIEFSPRLPEYDKRIEVGFVEPSYLAGFTGGRKMVMPGVSTSPAIARNHFLLLDPATRIGVLRGNAIAEDALEVAQAAQVDWICDVLVNPDDSWAGVYAGDMLAAHDQACRRCREIYRAAVPQKADIVLASSGPYPYDIDMVQAKKAVVPALEAVRPGGVIVLVGECAEGGGTEDGFVKHMSRMSPHEILTEMENRLHSGDQPWGWAPCSTAYLFSKAVHQVGAQVILVSGMKEQLKSTFVSTAASLEEALSMAEERVGRQSSVLAVRDGRRLIAEA